MEFLKKLTVITYKARQTVTPIPDLEIKAEEEFPDDITELPTLKSLEVKHAEEGVKIANALIDTLPGGTIDALLIELLEKKKTILSVKLF